MTSIFYRNEAADSAVAARVLLLQRTVPFIALIVGAISLAVILFWLFSSELLQVQWRALFVMKLNTAIGLLLSAAALWAARSSGALRRPAVWSCSVMVIVLALLILGEYVFQQNPGIDEFLVHDVAQVSFPGRTSPITASGLLLMGIAFLLAAEERPTASQVMFFLAAAAPITGLSGYLYNSPVVLSQAFGPVISLHAALCQLLLCLGGSLLRPDMGLMRIAVSESRAGAVSRILLPLAVVMPVMAGILIIAGERSGFMTVQFGSALLVSCCVVFFSGAVWMTTGMLWKAEKVQLHSEQALRRTRARLDAALIASEIGTWEWDVENDRVYADRNVAAMFGVSQIDSDGGSVESYLKAIHADDLALVKETISAAVDHGASYTCECRLVRPNGDDRWVLVRGTVVRDKDAKAIRLPGLVLDVTEKKQTELALRQAEMRGRLALDSAELGMWSVDPETMVLTTDERFRELFGVRKNLTYEEAVAAIHPDDQDKVRQAVAASSRPIDPVPYAVDYRVVWPDGTVKWVFAKGRSNKVGFGSHKASFDGTIADITDRKQREQERDYLLQSERSARSEAERAGRIKDEFLATLSHEIRTPLSAILGWSQIMKKSQSPKDFGLGLEVIERNARAQSQIIEDLLDMSRIISGKVRLDVQRIDLPMIVQSAVDTARPTAEAKGIMIRAVMEPVGELLVTGDGNRIQQVLWNLLTNAIKFTPKGGQVDVSLRRAGSHLEVSVADTGEGITPEFLPFVFDRFRQADASTTRRHGGLGLGLSIVRQIAELHGGTVRVTSAGPGQGATFVISLPFIALQETPGQFDLQLHPASLNERRDLEWTERSIEGIRVLLVDDEPDARQVVKRMLEERLAVVTDVGNVADALAQLSVRQYDVLLSDIGMPEEDGYSLIRRVRQLSVEQGGQIPAIALTARARAEDRVRAISAGFHMHLSKPVEAVELVTMIAAARRQ